MIGRDQPMTGLLRPLFFNGNLAVTTSPIEFRGIFPLICACTSGVFGCQVTPNTWRAVVKATGTPSSNEKKFE